MSSKQQQPIRLLCARNGTDDNGQHVADSNRNPKPRGHREQEYSASRQPARAPWIRARAHEESTRPLGGREPRQKGGRRSTACARRCFREREDGGAGRCAADRAGRSAPALFQSVPAARVRDFPPQETARWAGRWKVRSMPQDHAPAGSDRHRHESRHPPAR